MQLDLRDFGGHIGCSPSVARAAHTWRECHTRQRFEPGRGRIRWQKRTVDLLRWIDLKQREIASKGGKAAHQKGTAHEWTSEEAREAGRKGGMASHRRKAGCSKDESSGEENATLRK